MAKKTKMKGAELTQAMPKPDDKYETDNHLRTLSDAFDIMSDPEKMKKVHKLAGRRHKAVSSLRELKDIANKDHDADDEDTE